jgi:hypothetical protein
MTRAMNWLPVLLAVSLPPTQRGAGTMTTTSPPARRKRPRLYRAYTGLRDGARRQGRTRERGDQQGRDRRDRRGDGHSATARAAGIRRSYMIKRRSVAVLSRQSTDHEGERP